jgi:hypothetical protein
MGVTADTVAVVLQADVDRYIANLGAADSAFAKMTADAERDAARLGVAFSKIGGKPLGAVVQQAPQVNAALKSVNVNSGNVAAQFQDIAVQLQAGQSPFIIALQQGTQLSAALGTGGLKSVLSGLAGGLAGLVNPVSIATIGFIALGGVAIQALGSLVKETETATDVVDRHAKAIHEIVTGYKDAAQAADDYLADVQRLPQGKAIGQLASQAAQLRSELEEINAKLDEAANRSGTALEKRIGEVVKQFLDGKITAEQMRAAVASIAVDPRTAQGVKNVADNLEAAADKAVQLRSILFDLNFIAAELAKNSGVQFTLDAHIQGVDDALDTIKGITPELRTQRQILEDTYAGGLANAITQSQKDALKTSHDLAIAALDEADARDAAKAATAAATSESKKAADEKQREIDGVLSLIEALKFEQSTIGVSKEDQAVMTALRQAGAAATDTQRAQIEALVRQNYEETASLKEMQDALETVKGIAKDVLGTFISDLREGKSAGEALIDTFNKLADKLIDIAIQNLVANAFGALFPGGNVATSIASSFGFGRPVANGGGIQAGAIHPVGERGMELFAPGQAGSIIPNHKIRSAMGQDAGSGGGMSAIQISLGEGLEASILQKSASQSISITKAVVPSMIKRGAPQAVAGAQRDRVA